MLVRQLLYTKFREGAVAVLLKKYTILAQLMLSIVRWGIEPGKLMI